MSLPGVSRIPSLDRGDQLAFRVENLGACTACGSPGVQIDGATIIWGHPEDVGAEPDEGATITCECGATFLIAPDGLQRIV